MVLQIVLSIGAIYSLIPIVVIIILIAAAVGLTRGTDLFAIFGIGTLIGLKGTIGAGGTGKGVTRGPSIPKSVMATFKQSGATTGAAVKGYQKYKKKKEAAAAKLRQNAVILANKGSPAIAGGPGAGISATGMNTIKNEVSRFGAPVIQGAGWVPLAVRGVNQNARSQLSKGILFQTKTQVYGKPLIKITVPGAKTLFSAPAWIASLTISNKRMGAAYSNSGRPKSANPNSMLGRWYGRQRQLAWDFKVNRVNKGVPVLRRIVPGRFQGAAANNPRARAARKQNSRLYKSLKRKLSTQDYLFLMAGYGPQGGGPPGGGGSPPRPAQRMPWRPEHVRAAAQLIPVYGTYLWWKHRPERTTKTPPPPPLLKGEVGEGGNEEKARQKAEERQRHEHEEDSERKRKEQEDEEERKQKEQERKKKGS